MVLTLGTHHVYMQWETRLRRNSKPFQRTLFNINHLIINIMQTSSIAQRYRRITRPLQETVDVCTQPRSKSKQATHYLPIPRRDQSDRKQIEQPVKKSMETMLPDRRSIYRKLTTTSRKGALSQLKRYEDESLARRSISPYLKKDLAISLNKSNQKLKSGQLTKQLSPQHMLRHPKSSLSQHYEAGWNDLSNAHRRRSSLIHDERASSSLLEEARQYYKSSQYQRSLQASRRYLRIDRGSADAHYLLGMSLINLNDVAQGLKHLLETLNIDPNFKRSLYLVIALAYKRSGKPHLALQIVLSIDQLNRALNLYPDYYDCIVYRGKILMRARRYQEACQDFVKAITQCPEKGYAYVGKGICERQLGTLQEAVKTFSAGTHTDLRTQCLEKRAECKMQLGWNETCQELGYVSSVLHCTKGLILLSTGSVLDSLLCFQESLKCNNSQDAVTHALQMMIRTKIEQKDFYEAYHILTRSQNVDCNQEVVAEWKLFLESSLSLMKKKYKEGLQGYSVLQALPSQSQPLSQKQDKRTKQRQGFLRPLIHLYKAFGLLSENQQLKSEQQYTAYSKACQQLGVPDNDLSKEYNTLLIKSYLGFPRTSRAHIEASIKLIPSKPEPYLHLAFDRVNKELEEVESLDDRISQIGQIITLISEGINRLPQLSNNHVSTFYYYQAIMELYRNEFNQAVQSVDKAIEKSEDNIPKYFCLRGLIFACFGNFAQAIQDLSVAIDLDDKMGKAHLERAKCLQIQGNSNEAFLDLQKYITLAPDDPFIHKYAGFLLFQNCAYEDCLSAFSHGTGPDHDEEILLTQAKANFLLGNYQQSIQLLQEYHAKSFTSLYSSDIMLMKMCIALVSPNQQFPDRASIQSKLEQILRIVDEQKCMIFKFRDMHQLIGTIQLLDGNPELALKSFETTLILFRNQKKREMEKHFIQENNVEFEQEWSEIEIKFNISLCYAAKKEYSKAIHILDEFRDSSERGRNWDTYLSVLKALRDSSKVPSKGLIDVFDQTHRISLRWPAIALGEGDVKVSVSFSYPFVQPPELLPEFDRSLLQQFKLQKLQKRPQAPWINRQSKGLVFTPEVQVYENLELSMTSANNQSRPKPISQIDNSMSESNSIVQLETEELKRKFKLDSIVQMKLQKLIKK